jgi:hypothetical protein
VEGFKAVNWGQRSIQQSAVKGFKAVQLGKRLLRKTSSKRTEFIVPETGARSGNLTTTTTDKSRRRGGCSCGLSGVTCLGDALDRVFWVKVCFCPSCMRRNKKNPSTSVQRGSELDPIRILGSRLFLPVMSGEPMAGGLGDIASCRNG